MLSMMMSGERMMMIGIVIFLFLYKYTPAKLIRSIVNSVVPRKKESMFYLSTKPNQPPRISFFAWPFQFFACGAPAAGLGGRHILKTRVDIKRQRQ